MSKIIYKQKECFLCKKEKFIFTYWPSDNTRNRKLLCKDCAKTHLTKEAYEEKYNDYYISGKEKFLITFVSPSIDDVNNFLEDNPDSGVIDSKNGIHYVALIKPTKG